MVCLIQFALAGLGVWALWAPAIRYAGMVVRRPYTIYIGMVLLAQAPIGLLAGAAVAAAEGFKAAQTGAPVDPRRVQQKYGWLDPALVGGAVSLAVAVALAGMRPDLPEYLPPDEVTGVRDLIAEARERRAAAADAAEEWRGASDPTAAERRYSP